MDIIPGLVFLRKENLKSPVQESWSLDMSIRVKVCTSPSKPA